MSVSRPPHEKQDSTEGATVDKPMDRFRRLARHVINALPEEVDAERKKYETENALKNKPESGNND